MAASTSPSLFIPANSASAPRELVQIVIAALEHEVVYDRGRLAGLKQAVLMEFPHRRTLPRGSLHLARAVQPTP